MSKITAILILLLTPIAKADSDLGIYFEPNAGMEWGSFRAAESSVGDVSGMGIGARFGLQGGRSAFWGTRPFLAPDFRYSMLTGSFKELPGKVGFNNTQFGVTLGAKIPRTPIRGWVTYYFVDEGVLPFDLGTVGGTSMVDLKVKGSGLKFGAGVFLWNHLSLNLEYAWHGYHEARAENLAPTRFGVTLYNRVFIAGISAPFDFGPPAKSSEDPEPISKNPVTSR